MPSQAALFRRSAASRARAQARPHPVHEHEEHATEIRRPDGEVQEVRTWETHDAPPKYKTPRVLGTRRLAGLQDGDELPADGADVL
jgi:hypothetical protein